MGTARAHGVQARYGELIDPPFLASVWVGGTILLLPTGTHKTSLAGYVTDLPYCGDGQSNWHSEVRMAAPSARGPSPPHHTIPPPLVQQTHAEREECKMSNALTQKLWHKAFFLHTFLMERWGDRTLEAAVECGAVLGGTAKCSSLSGLLKGTLG